MRDVRGFSMYGTPKKVKYVVKPSRFDWLTYKGKPCKEVAQTPKPCYNEIQVKRKETNGKGAKNEEQLISYETTNYSRPLYGRNSQGPNSQGREV